MKRVLSLVIATSAIASVGVLFAGGANAATAGRPAARPSVAAGSNDICVGFLDPSGVQHPLFCINLPKT